MQDTSNSLRWRLGVCAALAFTVVSLIPQANFWRVRRHNWHGAYYSYHPDERPYSAYVNALIHGMPRRNDPYSGIIDQPGAPLPESVFSIQCVPAYAIAWPARLFRITASTAFMLLTPISAFASGLALFWLIGSLTRDDRLAAVAAVFVLCMGSLARGQYLVRHLGGIATPPIPFPFLRRYEPAFPFPLFILFCGFLWLMLTTKNRRTSFYSAIAASLTFALLVFSYYFLWTAAAALIVSLIIVWSVARPVGYQGSLRRLVTMAVLCLPALCLYAVLLANRAKDLDAFQALTFTRRPDLFRPPAILCLVLLLILVLLAWRRLIDRHDRALLFTASLSLSPLLMFNQQIVTGRSLQPIHYEQFVANYVSLMALVLMATILFRVRARDQRRIPTALLACIALVALGRGVFEARFAAHGMLMLNTSIDESWPAALHLAQMAQQQSADRFNSPGVVLILSPTFQFANAFPIATLQPVLWAPHSIFFGTLTQTENKERYFQHLYYAGVDLQTRPYDSYDRMVFRRVIFGWERTIPGLSVSWRPIGDTEEQAALQDYAAYVASFDRKRPSHPLLKYVIVAVNSYVDLSRVDRWYERDAGERVGDYVIYRVKLRP